MNSAPEGFTDAQWHQDAVADTGTDHVLRPRQYVIECEWCPSIFYGPTKAKAMEQLQRHRDEWYAAYIAEGVAAGDFPDPKATNLQEESDV